MPMRRWRRFDVQLPRPSSQPLRVHMMAESSSGLRCREGFHIALSVDGTSLESHRSSRDLLEMISAVLISPCSVPPHSARRSPVRRAGVDRPFMFRMAIRRSPTCVRDSWSGTRRSCNHHPVSRPCGPDARSRLYSSGTPSSVRCECCGLVPGAFADRSSLPAIPARSNAAFPPWRPFIMNTRGPSSDALAEALPQH